MNWNDYEAVWKRQELPVGANADVGALKATFEAKHRKMAAVLSASDMLEAGAGVLGCVAYGFIWRQVGRAGWPIAISIALILAVIAIFIRERFIARRNRLGSEATLLAKIEADIAVLRRRRKLTMGMWTWYLGPTALSVVILSLTLSFSRPEGDIERDALFLGGFGAFFALLLWFAWEINRRAVRKRLDPRIEELEKLRREILAEG
jgi:hypothetical protein